jgi:two-component system CAI-1 autoinducer sensor kinase/phosphatase CqsS
MQRLRQKSLDIVEHAEPNLPIIGLFATIGYPFFYLVWTDLIPQPYENLTLRLIEAAISLPWLFYRYLPKKAKAFFPIYFFASLPLLLPFFFHFMMLKNEWSAAWAMSSMAALFILILVVYDWRLICLITLIGFAMAYAAVLAIDGYVSYTYFQPEYVPTYLFALIGGIIANHRKQIAYQSRVSLLQSLSGSIAHEMRNPLSSITNAMSSLQAILPNKPHNRDMAEKFDLSYAGLINIHDVIEESSVAIRRGNKIIDSILASLQDGSLDNRNFKRHSAKNLIRTAINSYGYSSAQDRKLVHEKILVNFEFFGDKDLFVYVLFNLLKNALYYKERADFRIEISTKTGSAFNYIAIRDYGPGIPASKKERIFDRFYTYGKTGGNGLGLSFCKRVLLALGGDIHCNSVEGHWTEFVIKLPAYDSKTVIDLKKGILKNKRILLVDDQISNRLLLTKYLTEWSCQFDEAENGKQAIEMAARNRYDLIFMDFEMPELNGDSAIASLRSARNLEPSAAVHYLQVPVIGITALPRPEAIARSAECGMNDVLSKPVRRPDINRIFERYFFSESSLISLDQQEAISGSRILLVDDNETNRKFMAMILEYYGCSTGQAENGKAAIELLEQQDFDIILMDMEMPVMNGMVATREIRTGKHFSRFTNFAAIPIIALTGNTDADSIRRSRDAGMNQHLGKPVFKEELISTITIWLKTNNNGNIAQIVMPDENPMTPDPVIFEKKLASEKILDRSILNSLLETGGSALLDSILKLYMADTAGIIEKLRAAAATGNMKSYDMLIHTLKGSSGSCGANRMYVLARHINDFSRNGTWPENEAWLAVLQETYDATCAEFSRLLDEDAS